MFGMKIVILNWNNKCGRQKFGLLMDTEVYLCISKTSN